MLTVDLVRARRKDGRLLPAYLRGAAAARLLPVARFYAEAHARLVGEKRDHVEAVLATLEVPARDRVAALGLRKVIEDRCEFEVEAAADPEELRHDVFWAAAAAHRALDVRAELDREAVLAEVAARRGTTVEAIEAGLYADLRGSEILKRVEPISPEAAIERYNLGLAQAILLRAARVVVRVEAGEAGDTARYRRLFRAARFHQLIHVVEGSATSGYTITLDGPFSLFDAVQRYGLRLALFLPSVLAFPEFHVRADVLWGKERSPAVFEIEPGDGLVPAPARSWRRAPRSRPSAPPSNASSRSGPCRGAPASSPSRARWSACRTWSSRTGRRGSRSTSRCSGSGAARPSGSASSCYASGPSPRASSSR